MPLQTLEDVFNEQLKDVYSAENQILKALPKMAKNASSPELREAFEEHLEQTREQVARLDRIMEMIGASGKGKKCKGMEGLLEEGKEVLEEKREASGSALDAAMIAAAQRVEHYEIAAYGSLCAYAKQLGNRDALALLKETLSEEEETDKRLTHIAGSVNLEAAAEQPERSSGRKSARTRTAR
ncbi:MAG TPA: ferritin-like domain-containing protein [Bryobacteraceae bacterium]|jgi:ferritin-like metal-binding protein YciE|nr:ferritin-like domain-containing protein [Bryobacteraceae bacterium]